MLSIYIHNSLGKEFGIRNSIKKISREIKIYLSAEINKI